MSRSRAAKEQLEENGTCRRKHADGERVDNWMQNVHPKKGALHKQMGIPSGDKIPTKALKKATHSPNKLLEKRAELALRYRGK